MTTEMRAALVTVGPAWPGDREWTGHYLFSSAESARRYFDSEPRVLSIMPDYSDEFFPPFEVMLTRLEEQCIHPSVFPTGPVPGTEHCYTCDRDISRTEL